MAEPAARRQLRVRRAAPSARAERARERERDPRPRPLGAVDDRRAGAAPGRNGTCSLRNRAIRSRCGSRIEYSLSDDGLTVRTTATNVGASACPYGSGAHPYLTVGTPTVDSRDPAHPPPKPCCADDRGLPPRLQPGRGHGVRLPPAQADRRDEARPRFHRSRAWRGRARPRRPRRPSPGLRARALGRRGLRLPTGLQRRSASRRQSPEPRGRADDLPAERLPNGDGLIRLEPGESVTSAWGISSAIEITPSG